MKTKKRKTSLVFKKKGYLPGKIRDYGKYGKYQKQTDGTWKRLKKGYPQFRRTSFFKRRREFMVEVKGYGSVYIDGLSSLDLKEMIKSCGFTREFNRWLEDKKNGKKKEE